MIYSYISQLKSKFCVQNILLCIIKLWEELNSKSYFKVESKKLQL